MKDGYFRAAEPAFTGKDFCNALKRVKAFDSSNSDLCGQICDLLMKRGILIRMDGEDKFEKGELKYSLTYFKPIIPSNMIFVYENEVHNVYEVSKELVELLQRIYDEFFGKRDDDIDFSRIYESVNFLNYLQQTTMLQSCDIQSLSKIERIAFFFNIKQCVYFHEYFINKGDKFKENF